MKSLFAFVLSVLAFGGLSGQTAIAADISTNRPLLAIWRDTDGYRPNQGAPYLRIAIWNDGRVVFAKDAGKWGHELLEGRIDTNRLAELKQAIEKTGVFELKGNCYLVIDAAMDCVMVDLGGKQQMLYWDEVETPGYGINISPTENHLEFKRCWKEVNALALGAVPKETQRCTEHFTRPPDSWRPRRPIQSK